MAVEEEDGGGIREVPFGALRDEATGPKFCDNKVITSKYTLLTFVPLNLYEQFQKAANVYFLLISIAMAIGETTDLYMEAIKAYSTFLVLGFMMCVSAVMAAIDDWRRHKSDKDMNSQDAQVVLAGSEPSTTTWEKVNVGDVLVVRADEELPADIVLLASSGDEGNCYVSTANLDGETNLKLKTALGSMQGMLVGTAHVGAEESDDVLAKALTKLKEVKGTVQAEKPTNSIHSFSGALRMGDAAPEEALNPKQLLLRGTMLRNTNWVVGLVVYTGKDTRVIMNSRKAPMKISNLERIVNQSMVVIFITQGVLAVISTVCFNINSSTYREYWYLYPGGSGAEIILPEPIGYWITFFILYSNMMPISLYATIEFCNAAQALYIKCDPEMYDWVFDFPAMVRSTNLIQELGQVRYIFSDKTGTLTQNVMELKRVCIAGKVYGRVGEERGFQGKEAMMEAKARDVQDRDAIDAFLEVLAVSHTVMVTTDKKGKTKFEAESPDEDALVKATAQLGWAFSGRAGPKAWVDVGEPGNTTRRTYTTLAVNAFTSSRKRMSVIVKRDSGDHYLFIKGADNVMLERTVSSDPLLQGQLTDFAREGLRTLVIGRRKLRDDDVASWLKEYERALVAIEDRDGCLERVAEKIETRLELIGATAIEDKLQTGVATTIVRLRRGGIKLWVLTGDKLETARNIGFSTRVLSEDMNIMILDCDGKEDALLKQRMEETSKSVEKAQASKTVCGLMVTGQALEKLMGSGQQDLFLDIAQQCSVVIACRVSPLQKAQMVQLVRTKVKPSPVTLAVGDGANDVPMIQEAQVGVGICGREGRQAVNSADFAIGQFRFLQRLLLVHGRLDYMRTCKFILYTFWRNVMQVLLMFYYSFVSGYSGISIFEDKVRMMFNVILFLPIVATGIFDRDVEDWVALARPEVYESGRLGLELNPYKMFETVISALLHSLAILAISTLAFPGMELNQAGDYYSYGTAVYSFLIISSNYRVAFMTITWNWVSVTMQAISFSIYTIFLAVYGVWRWIEPAFYSVPYHMAANAPFWVCCFAVPALSLFIDTTIWYVCKELKPTRRDLLLEQQMAGQLAKLDDAPDSGRPGARPEAFGDGSAQLRTAATGPASPTLIGQPRDVSDAAEEDRDDLVMRNSKGEIIMRTKKPPTWKFVQERFASWQFILTWRRAAGLMLLPGGLLFLLGAVALVSSRSANQMRIHYAGDYYGGPPGTKPEEVYDSPCGLDSSCVVNVTAVADMEPPIMLFYAVDPFFQNYNHYVRSVSNAEMSGGTPSTRQTCTDSLADSFQGENMVPCGLRALYMFNDTFEVLSHTLDTTGAAWEADVEFYANPPDYPNRPQTSWLFSRFPSIPGLREEGVKNQAFASWARPSAMPCVQKTYGFLRTGLAAGDTVTIRINSSFPVGSLNARKELVLTTLTSMGARDDRLGLFLLICGGICLLSGILVVLLAVIMPRAPGKPGLLSGDMSTEEVGGVPAEEN